METLKKERGEKMNMNKVFEKYAAVVFFDTETTGLDADTCRIIELAAIRIEQAENGTLRTASRVDLFVKLPEGQKIPDDIVKLTGITDERLEAEGFTEAEAAAIFTHMIHDDKGTVLLVAHNAQFDLQFVREMFRRNPRYVTAPDGSKCERADVLVAADYLDSLTVYKDRRGYPHKLVNAIVAYKLQDKVKNSHRAIDDVEALFEVVKAMDNERADLLTYVNLFGYNPKYGVSGRRLVGVTYWPQQFNNYIQAPGNTLPGKIRRARK